MPKQILNSIISETTKIKNWSETKVGHQFRCWTCVQTNKQASKPGRRKIPNEVPSSIEYWIEEEEEKTRQIEKGSRKKMSETTNWLRLRSHSYLVQKLPKNGPKTPFSPILSAICAVLFIHLENSYRYRLNKLEIFRIFLLYAVATHLQ